MYNEIMCIIFFNKEEKALRRRNESLHQAHRHQLNGVAGKGEDNAGAVDVRHTETRSDEGIGEGEGQLFMAPIYLFGRS